MGGPIVFGPFTFDAEVRELRRNGVVLHLAEQPSQILTTLLEQPGRVVTREELHRRLWAVNTFVDFEQGLNKAVTRLRESLGDNADHPLYIETIPRRGYRFIGSVQAPAPAAPPRRALMLGLSFALAALAAGSLWLFLANRPAPVTSIAVLPFANLTGDPQHDPEADAFTDAIISRLAQVSAFQRVISRTSVSQFKATKKPIPEIARSLRVDAIVEGSLQQSAERVKASVRLFRAAGEAPIWSHTYERDARDVFALQSEMAIDLANHAQAALTRQEQSRVAASAPVDPALYRAFLRGRHFCREWIPASMEQGLAELRSVIERDPSNSMAQTEYASCQIYTFISARMPLAKSAVEQALRADPENPSARAVHGLVLLIHDLNWAAAEREFLRALELAPADARVHYDYSLFLAAMARFDEALRAVDRAIELSPADMLMQQRGAWVANKARRHELALEYSNRAHELERDSELPYEQMCWALLQLGRLAEADSACGRVRRAYPARTDLLLDSWLIPYDVAFGRRKEAEEIGRFWLNHPASSVEPWDMAALLAGLGHSERALDFAEQAYEERSRSIYLFQIDNLTASLRRHPRGLALLQKLDFPPSPRARP
jgi:TolB-like protein/DNA-binding winged helix-turn-helix (wHTH) protein/Tfp pilus assembly protein PilF